MTRFTRCEPSPSFRMIVVRSAPCCHRTALAKVPERTDKTPQKGTGRAPEGFLKGRRKGARRVSSRQRLPLPFSPSSSLPFPSHHHHHHLHHLRSSFGSRSTRTSTANDTQPWSASVSSCPAQRSFLTFAAYTHPVLACLYPQPPR